MDTTTTSAVGPSSGPPPAVLGKDFTTALKRAHSIASRLWDQRKPERALLVPVDGIAPSSTSTDGVNPSSVSDQSEEFYFIPIDMGKGPNHSGLCVRSQTELDAVVASFFTANHDKELTRWNTIGISASKCLAFQKSRLAKRSRDGAGDSLVPDADDETLLTPDDFAAYSNTLTAGLLLMTAIRETELAERKARQDAERDTELGVRKWADSAKSRDVTGPCLWPNTSHPTSVADIHDGFYRWATECAPRAYKATSPLDSHLDVGVQTTIVLLNLGLEPRIRLESVVPKGGGEGRDVIELAKLGKAVTLAFTDAHRLTPSSLAWPAARAALTDMIANELTSWGADGTSSVADACNHLANMLDNESRLAGLAESVAWQDPGTVLGYLIDEFWTRDNTVRRTRAAEVDEQTKAADVATGKRMRRFLRAAEAVSSTPGTHKWDDIYPELGADARRAFNLAVSGASASVDGSGDDNARTKRFVDEMTGIANKAASYLGKPHLPVDDVSRTLHRQLESRGEAISKADSARLGAVDVFLEKAAGGFGGPAQPVADVPTFFR
ncbi:hypothetical protein Q5752_001102 [Cryptotrichosporon argae]